MTKASDNEFPSLLVKEGTAPSSPAAGDQRVYIDSTSHHLSRKNSGGTVTDLETGSASVASAVKAYNNTTQSLSAATLTAVTFNSEEMDTDGYHDTGSNTDRLTVPSGKAGVFLAEGYVYTPVNGAAVGRFTKNGSVLRAGTVGIVSGSSGGFVVSAGPLTLADGDIIRLEAYVASGGNIGSTNADQMCWASLVRIGS